VHSLESVDLELPAAWDIHLQAVRGTDVTVALMTLTSAVMIAVHVLLQTASTVDPPAFAPHIA
jgi:hypothetical protein